MPVSLRRVARLFGAYRARLSLLLALIFLAAGLGVVSPFLLREVLDNAIPQAKHDAAGRARAGDDRAVGDHERDRGRADAGSQTRSASA